MRLTSGVPGFDGLVEGGLPLGTSVIVQGPAGKEKDTFLFQFVVEGLQKGGSALVVLSSVSPARYEQELRDAGVDVDLAFAENRLKFVDWFTYKEETVQDVQQDGSVYRASIDLANVGIAVSRAIAALPREGEKRAAVEILSPALSVYDLPAVYGFAQSTKAKLERFGFTALFVIEKEMHEDRTLSSLHQPFDGVVDIERVREGDALVRKVAVLSLKGTAAQSKYVHLEVGPDRVLRVSTMSEREKTLRRQEELIKSNPKDPKIWIATARNLRAMGETDRALKCVEAALNLDAKDEETWRFKAELLDALGRREEAAEARSRAAPVVPAPRKDEASTRLLGVVEARLRQNPRDPDALFVKAAAYAKIENLAEAIDALETLAIVDDAYPGLWVLKAKLHARRGEREKAQQARLRSQDVEKRQAAREKESKSRLPPPPETVFECPQCGAAVGEHDAVCPSCGVVFEGVEEPPEPKREIPPPKPKPELERRGFTNGLVRESPRGVGRTNGLVNGTRGRTNGLVNGTRGRTNGLVNGTRGRTNGLVNGTRGRTNGVTNGLVNGLRSLRAGMTNGLTNGSGFTNGLGAQRYARELRRNRWKLFLIPAVFAVLAAAPLLNSDLGGPGGPVIDGAFDDWSGVPQIPLTPDGNNTNVALTHVALVNGTSRLSLLVEVQGQMLAGGPGPTSDVIFVFVDHDRSAGTGYPIRGIGADRLLEISGVGGAVVRAVAYRFSLSVADVRDWRGWTDPAPIAAAAGGNRLEIAVDWLLLADRPSAPVLLVASLGWNGATNLADLITSPAGGALRVVQRHTQPTTLSGANVPLLAVELTAVDANVAVAGLSVDLVGTAPLSAVSLLQVLDGTGTPLAQRVPVSTTVAFAFPPVTLSSGAPQTWTIAASVGGVTRQTLGAELPGPYAVLAGDAAVTVSTVASGERLGYLGQAPAGPIVDGAFAEWTGDVPDATNEPSALGNPSIDLDRFGAILGASNLTFHVSVRGPAFAGTVLTTYPPRSASGGPAAPDRDRDTVPDDAPDTFPDDFDNDGTPDAQENGDHDSDSIVDYPFGGTDYWLNTTIPGSFPAPYAGRNVSVYVGPTYQAPAIGEDRVRLFVDADNVSATGFYVQGIGADYLVEVVGRDGIVAAANVSAHSGANPWVWGWTWQADMAVGTGLTQFEAVAALAIVVPDPAYFLEVSDWRGGTDTIGSGTRGTRSAPIFDGPSIAFVPTTDGEFAYRTTGTDLEVYAREARGPDPEIVLRYGSLFLGWRTTAMTGLPGGLTVPATSDVRAAGQTLAIGGLDGAWEEYALSDTRVKHNVWLSTRPEGTADYVGVEGILSVTDGATVLVDGQPTNGTFATAGDLVISYDGHAVRLEAPFAYESIRPDLQVAGRYRGTVNGTSIRLAMEIPAAWLRDPSRSFPVVLDPTATGIVDTSTSASPTGGPHQRNVFYDGTNFWAFYFDGTTTQYEPSADGLSWVNTKSAAFTSAGVSRVSVWFHATGSIVYITGLAGATDKDARVRRGTISGTTISWGTEAAATLSSSNVVLMPYITRDSSGYVWIVSNSKESATQFNFVATRSTNTDDVSAWNARTLLMTSIANDYVQGIVLPLGSGDMYAIWYADGSIYGKRYTASNSTWWTNADTIDTTSAGALTKAPSAVVDGSNNIHLVYADSSGAVKYRQRTSSWSSATTLDAASGSVYPVISRDTGTGDLYVFYVSSTNQIKAQRYSGSWSSVTLETNTKAKTGLSSGYSVASSSNVAWAWGQGAASPYDVKISVLSTSLTSRTIDTSTESTPGSYNHQRKVLHDGAGRFWAFYYDGTNTVYTWSDDAMTWENAVSQAFTTTGVDNPSVWFHDTGSTKIVYAVGDTSGNDQTLNVRRGTISGTTITWGTEASVTVGSSNYPNKVAFITRDSSGYLWIVSSKKSSVSTYNVGVVRSTNTDDVSAWGSVTDLLTAAISGTQVYPSIVPLNSGNVYALWYADGAIDGKLYSGSWGSLENIATTTTGVSTKIPSAVVDGSGNIDLVYIDSSGAVQHKQRTSSWGSATAVDSGSGNTSPTITRDTSNGDLYVFYLQSTSQIKGRKNSGSWSDVSGIDTSTITKGYVSSPYSVSAAWKVSWLWGQGGTSPYEVKIARLPEFQDILVPVGVVVALVVAIRRRREARGDE